MRRALLSTLFAVTGATLLYRQKARSRPSRRSNEKAGNWGSLPPAAVAEDRDRMQRYLLLAILPIWAAAGISDYLWHKRTKIETTSGTEESVTHALMMIEMAPAVLAGLFLEINAGTLALMTAAYVVHEATVLWDVSYAVDKRVIPPGEQHTHSHLETIPLNLVLFAAFTHWEQALALLGKGPEVPRFAFRLRQPPLSAPYVISILGAIGLFVGLPHAEELWRCWKAQKQGLIGRDTHPCTQELFRHEGVERSRSILKA